MKNRSLQSIFKEMRNSLFKQPTEKTLDYQSTKMIDRFSDVTAILTVWKRDHLEQQLAALYNQTEKPSEIWIYHCGTHVDLTQILRRHPWVEYIKSSVNLKYFGRFSLAQYASTKYVWILDDDVIPGPAWLLKCKNMCEQENAIISSAGRIIPPGDYRPERPENVRDYYHGDLRSNAQFNYCPMNTRVDYGCNSWFFKQPWINTFWSYPPRTMESAEDMHLSSVCNIHSSIQTIVPKQTDTNTSGNLNIAYGMDEFSSFMKPGFNETREQVLHYLIDELGWKPILW